MLNALWWYRREMSEALYKYNYIKIENFSFYKRTY